MNSKYLTYTSQDLAQDDAFITWSRAGRPVDGSWSPWLNKNPEVRSIIDEADQILLSLRYSERVIPSSQTDAIWNRINKTISEDETKVKDNVVTLPRRSMMRTILYAAAACLALLLGSRLLLNQNVDVYAGPAHRLAHVLPDASKVEINADSRIKYDPSTWEAERSLTLDGEAYFEVEKGQKFTVHTALGDVVVLGTAFNIYSRKDGFKVICTSGRVQVTSGAEHIILTPGMSASLNNGTLLEERNPEVKVDWLNQLYSFDAAPLKEVFESLQRQFDVNVTLDRNLEDKLYTGSFEAVDLSKALNAICFPMELSSEIKGKNISIALDANNK